MPTAISLFFAKAHEPVFVNIAQSELTVAGLNTIKPVALQCGGTQRNYQRARLKLSTRDAFLVIKLLILILLFVTGYSPLSPFIAINCNRKNTLNY